jgi:hypothetical protein
MNFLATMFGTEVARHRQDLVKKISAKNGFNPLCFLKRLKYEKLMADRWTMDTKWWQ